MHSDLFLKLIIVLVASHTLSDFVLQTQSDVSRKAQTVVLMKHGFTHGVLSYAMIGWWSAIWIVLMVGLLHILMDAAKTKFEDDQYSFLLDQFVHLVSLVLVASFLASLNPKSQWLEMFSHAYVSVLIDVIGFVVSVFAVGYYLRYALSPFQTQESKDRLVENEMVNGGKIIGRLERALIFVFVISNQMAGIGFLVTAKSILRFGELKEPSNLKKSEYIIIGTFYSFLLAILVALASVKLKANIQ